VFLPSLLRVVLTREFSEATREARRRLALIVKDGKVLICSDQATDPWPLEMGVPGGKSWKPNEAAVDALRAKLEEDWEE